MDGPNRSEMVINVFNPAAAHCLQTKKVYPIKGKTLNISLVKKKTQNAWLENENSTLEWETDTKTIINHLPCADFIGIYSSSSVFTLQK